MTTYGVHEIFARPLRRVEYIESRNQDEERNHEDTIVSRIRHERGVEREIPRRYTLREVSLAESNRSQEKREPVEKRGKRRNGQEPFENCVGVIVDDHEGQQRSE